MTSSVSSVNTTHEAYITDTTVTFDPNLQELWIEMLQTISKKIQRTQFITWFKDTALLSRDGGTLIIGLPLPMALNWHLEHYRTLTLGIAQDLDETIEKIVYNVDGSLKDNREKTIDLLEHFPEAKRRKLPNRQEVKIAEGMVSKIVNPRYSLENFVVGTNNRLAHAAASAVATDPGGKYNPLFIYGGVGLGKTHLLQATGNAILRKQPRAALLYCTAEDFTNQLVEAVRTRKMEQLRRRFRFVDVLIIDDVQFLANKERTQEEFFHTFNVLYEEHKQIVISADRPPQELLLEDRLISRFERGMIADVSAPDYETRLAILSEKAQEYELFIDLSVLQFIAEHTSKNVRELEGILMQAVAQYELEKRMPTVKSIASIMRKLSKDPHETDSPVGFELPPSRQCTFEDVLEAVSAYYSVSVADMLGKSRVREILTPRHIAMYLGKAHKHMSYVSIGRIFSHRDHTTVMNAVKKITKNMQTDAQLLREIRALAQELGLERR